MREEVSARPRRFLMALVFLALGLSPAWGVELTPDLLNPYELIRGTLPPSAASKPLPVFPERLIYQVHWGILSVGETSLSVEQIVDFAGRPAYAVISEARSNAFCGTFYKVRDLNESWIDAATHSSLGYSKKLREGHFFRDEWVLFDSERRRYLARTTHRDGSFRVQTGTAPAFVQDVLSSLYFIRSMPLTVGAEAVLDVNTKDNWPLVARVTKKEKISTPAGKFSTIVVEPALRREGIFIQKGKRLRVWVTDDERRMPVMIKVEVFFGHITVKLSKML